jgi:hypothetical protein
MMAENPKDRPTAREILRHPLLQTETEQRLARAEALLKSHEMKQQLAAAAAANNVSSLSSQINGAAKLAMEFVHTNDLLKSDDSVRPKLQRSVTM